MADCASVVMSHATAWGVLLGAALFTGCGFGGLVLLLNTAFARGFAERGVLRLNLLNAVFGVGAIGGPLVIGLAPHEDLPYVFLVVGLLILLCWPVRGCAVLLRERSTAGSPRGRRNLPILLSFAAIGLVYAATE